MNPRPPKPPVPAPPGMGEAAADAPNQKAAVRPGVPPSPPLGGTPGRSHGMCATPQNALDVGLRDFQERLAAEVTHELGDRVAAILASGQRRSQGAA